MAQRGGRRTFSKADHPAWQKGDRVRCLIACPANDNVIGDVGTVLVEFRRVPSSGEWTRVHVRWDRNGMQDMILPWEIEYDHGQ